MSAPTLTPTVADVYAMSLLASLAVVAEIRRLQQMVQDLEDRLESAHAQVSAEQRSHLAYRLRNPSRPKTPQPTARPVHDIGEGV